MFSKILIANRGEVAIRIIRACKEMGIASVAVFSEADRSAMHVALADESVCIGGASPSESYLNAERVISAAIATGVQAIHPGYGFLSESPRLSDLCEKNRIAFIGPKSDVLKMMGDKDEARRLMAKAGVQIIPGSEVVADVEEAKKAAKKLGYPVMLKARAGGGGKGIRTVLAPEEMEAAFNLAFAEALTSFGDGALFVEKRIFPAKHIEVQMLVDEYGNTICLGERECSIQKKNQKLLEESPSLAVNDKLRKNLYDFAKKAAKAANLLNAGTIEFMVDKKGNVYFMEMNVRLQVEHGITEQVTGVDIVKWQIRIAAGVKLDFTQSDVVIRGHSIECRINAETVGKVAFLHVPGGPEVRFDSALWTGYTIPIYYDALIGKLMVHASTREEAIRKMHAALCELVIDGVKNNIDDQISFISAPEFQDGDYYTDFIEKRGDTR